MLRILMLLIPLAVFSLGLIPTYTSANLTLELPAPGHWLMTSYDLASAVTTSERVPDRLLTQPKIDKPREVVSSPPLPRPPKPKEFFHGNRSQDNINIGVMWVDGKKLKAFTITTINPKTHKAAVAGVPLFAYNTGDKSGQTVAELYHTLGPKDFIKKMEMYIETDIDYNIVLEHATFIEASELIGFFSVAGETTTCLKIFEETAADKRTDDEQVVRAVAGKVLAPESWLIIPKLVFIFTQGIELNMSAKQMYELYREFRKCNTDTIKKNSLAGVQSYAKGKRTRAVEPERWANILYSLTN